MHWFQNLALSKKLIGTFSVVLVLVGGLSFFAYQTTVGSLQSAHWVDHTHKVMGNAKSALAGLVDMETGYRGFLVTGKDEFLEPYKNGKVTYQAKLDQLQELTADNPGQVGRWQDLERRAAAWQREVTEPGMALRRAVTAGNATSEQLVRFESSGLGKKHFDGMRAVFAQAIGEEEGLLGQRTSANANANQTLLQVLSWGTLGTIILGVMIAFLLARSLSGPLGEVVHAIQQIAQGDLEQEIALERKDEIGQLAEAFEALTLYIRTVAQAVDGLSRGDLSVKVTPRSEKDILALNMGKAAEAMGKLTQQAATMADDDLNNPILDEEIEGELGSAFKRMIQRMQFVAGQAELIANDDLYNEMLRDQGEGTLGGAMANMVRNLRQIQQDLKAQMNAAEVQRQQVLAVASDVTTSSATLAVSAEQLATNTSQLSQGSAQQEQIVDGVAAAIQELATSAEAVASNADSLASLVTTNATSLSQLADSINAVTLNADQMSQTMISNASGIEELAAAIRSQAKSAQQASQTAEQTRSTAQEGAEVVRQAIEGMERIADRVHTSSVTVSELGKSSTEISSIVGVINDIADQTNLLALNAAIEAARAGEQGKGFAVVADEVRKLAEGTAGATQKIEVMIGKIQTDTQQVVESMEQGVQEAAEGTQLAQRSQESLAEIGQGVQQVSDLLQRLSKSTDEQAITSDEIVQATTQLQELVSQVTAATGEQARAVEGVSQAFQQMHQLVETVTLSTKEQSETTAHTVHSVEEVNQVTKQAQEAIQELGSATNALAEESEGLQQLALRFGEKEELLKDGDKPVAGSGPVFALKHETLDKV